jgi:hypothetical protein
LDNQELIRALEALQVASSQVVPSSSTAIQDQPVVARSSKLLLMVADPREGTRSIPEAIARSDLSNLWRGRLISLDEVTANLFLATFRTEGDSMSVIRGQPWTLRNNNLLIELYVQGRATNQYAFQFLEANVRLYGIPSKFRTEYHISRIVQMIGHLSDWHRLNPRYFDSDLHYVAIKVKIDATKPVVDKVFYSVPQLGSLGTIIIWVHYEKIKRICTYCAKLFHNAKQCPNRAQSILVAGEDQGFDRFGLWMTQANRIPMQLVENQLTTYQDVVPGPSYALQELRQAFAGVRMGTSMVQPPRSLHAAQGIPVTSGIPVTTITDVTSGIPVTTTTDDDMILDNLALVPITTHQNEAEILQSLQNQLQQIVPVSISHGTPQIGQNQQQQIVPTTVHHHSEPTHTSTWIQNHSAYNPSSQVTTSQQAMLQFTQYNIQQTQVQVQVTTQVDTYPIISTQRQPQSTIGANNESLPLNYPHITAPLRSLPLENQFSLPHLPPEPRASPPPQRQRRILLHPTGQNWNHAFDKGKAVITHAPSTTVAPPQTLATGIN